jgi:aryl-alcohol dehydrogenase-like predicted oxidoreductase
MKRTRLGKSDLVCSVLGLGTWGLGGVNNVSGKAVGWRSVDKTQARNTIAAALDEGINFFDSSDFYGLGAAEELLGEMLPKSTPDIVVATKVGLIPSLKPGTTKLDRNFSAGHIESALNASLVRLRRDYVDLYQLHGPELKTLPDETWGALERLKASGKIRHVGVSLKSSGFDNADFNLLTHHPLVTFVQTRYNLIHIRQANFIDGAQVEGLDILARSIFEHGFLTGRYSSSSEFPADDHRSTKLSAELLTKVDAFFRQVRATFSEDTRPFEIPLRYTLSSPNVALGIIGATSAEQVKENVEAAGKPPLTEAERQHIGSIAEAIFSPRNVD